MADNQGDTQKIDDILTRGVSEIIHERALRAKLLSEERLRVKFGIDPTSPHIHLGRASAIWKLRDFQELGHTIVFIVGDFTGVIGDTSDKESERPVLSREVVAQNLVTYFEQAGKILDMNTVEKRYNSEWLAALSYREISEHADVFSVSDFIARENIRIRLDAGRRVSLREVLYPLMQGYDSVAVRSDIEIGGTDQRFNMLAGRKLQEHFGKAPQNIITLSLLEGLDGRKMSSSFGNTINLSDVPGDMFGKVMSLRDEFIVAYFVQATRVPLEQIGTIREFLSSGGNPRDAKLDLAQEIVSMYHGKEAGISSRAAFLSVFQKREIPADILEISRTDETGASQSLGDLFVFHKIVSSKTQWRRLVSDGAARYFPTDGTEQKITQESVIARNGVYKIGKKRFIRIV